MGHVGLLFAVLFGFMTAQVTIAANGPASAPSATREEPTVRVFHLKDIKALRIAAFVRQRLCSKAGQPTVEADANANALKITGNTRELAKAAELLAQLDRPLNPLNLTSPQACLVLDRGPAEGPSKGFAIQHSLMIHGRDGRLHLEIDGNDMVVDAADHQVRAVSATGEQTATRFCLSLQAAHETLRMPGNHPRGDGNNQNLWLDAPDGVLRLSDDGGHQIIAVHSNRVKMRRYANEFEFERLHIDVPIPPQTSMFNGNHPSGRLFLPPVFTSRPSGAVLTVYSDTMQTDAQRVGVEAQCLCFPYARGKEVWKQLLTRTHAKDEATGKLTASDLDWLLSEHKHAEHSSSLTLPRMILPNDKETWLGEYAHSIVDLPRQFGTGKELVTVNSGGQIRLRAKVSKDSKSVSVTVGFGTSRFDESAVPPTEAGVSLNSTVEIPDGGTMALRCEPVLNRIKGMRPYRRKEPVMGQTPAEELAREPNPNAAPAEFVIVILRPKVLPKLGPATMLGIHHSLAVAY